MPHINIRNPFFAQNHLSWADLYRFGLMASSPFSQGL